MMPGIDRFLSTYLSQVIKKNLDEKILKNVEKELFFKYGMSIKLSIEHFQQFLSILKENSTLDINKFQTDCINEIIKIRKIDGKYFIKIINQQLANLVFEYIGNSEVRKILLTLLANELTIPEILEKSKMPKTTGYRKIENMIIIGLIIETSRVLSESKKISKYTCCFNEIKTRLKKNNLEVIGIIDRKLFEKSTCIRGRV